MTTDTPTLLETPLNHLHRQAGARMMPFGGWDMPLQFGKVLEEHHAVRKQAGLFDICHMGLLQLSGKPSEAIASLLNRLVPQNLLPLPEGKAVYTQLLNPLGGIIDDIIVYHMPPSEIFKDLGPWLVICNASNTPPVLEWLKVELPELTLTHRNAQFGLLALQGPAFRQVLNAVGLSETATLPKRFHLAEFQLGDIPVLLSRTGYTGEDGVEIIVLVEQIEALWQALLATKTETGILPIGLAARDTLRLEAAYPLHGAELSPVISPLQADLGWSVRLEPPEDFIGKQALVSQKEAGLTTHFVCFEVLKRSIPRHFDKILDASGQPVGEVTSGSISPTLDKPIGVGYIHGKQPLDPGTPIQIEIRGQQVPAQVVKRPFYQLT